MDRTKEKMSLNYTFNPSWAKIVSKFEDGKFLNFSFSNQNELCSFNYIKRDISKELDFLEKDTYFDIITPFDYGGFYYDSEDILIQALDAFNNFCIKENIISGFFRFNPLLTQNYNLISKYVQISKIQEHIYIDLKKDYLSNFSNRKKRNIKKAQKYNYKFIINDSIDNFYAIYLDSMERVNSSQYFKFDKNSLKELTRFGKIFSITFDEQVVTSIFIIEDKKEIYYFLGGTKSRYMEYGFNSLLFRLVADYYKDTKQLFFLGGGKDGLYEYKKEFSKKTTPFYIGKQIYNKEIYDKLAKQNNKENNVFFPKYREKTI